MKQSFKIIAIDGGAGSGKSTTASILSQRLNLLHVDTGLHYRAVTQSLLNKLGEVKNFESYLNKNKISFDTILSAKKSLIVVDGQTYSLSELRSKRINESVSNCASIPSVRNALLDYQRSLVSYAKENDFLGVVMEGRDIGSVVLPDADLKIFLVAAEGIRQDRREKDGEIDQIKTRDKLDSTRAIAPLLKTDDSLIIDTGTHSIEEVYSKIHQTLGF
mgnify:CR=1 FL=1